MDRQALLLFFAYLKDKGYNTPPPLLPLASPVVLGMIKNGMGRPSKLPKRHLIDKDRAQVCARNGVSTVPK